MKTTLKNILLFFALTFAFQGTLLAQDAPLTAEEYYKLGKEQYYDGDYFKAVESFNKVLDLRLKIYDSNSETLIKPYIRLAKAHEKLRDNLQAIGYLKEALRIVEHNNLPPDQYSPNIFLEMGNTYDNLRRLKEALHYCTKALEIYKKEYGPESPEVGTTYMNMGTVSLSQGYYRNAEQYLHQAFDIIKKSAEPNSVDFNRIYLNLSALYQKTGDFEKAITYGEKALAIKLLNYDRTHPSVPKYFTNLGYSYLDNGDFEKGVGYMEESLQLTKTIFGENHQNTGAAYGSLASYYRGVQNYPKALYFQKKSVAIKEKTLAPDHHYFLGDLLNLGHTYAIGEKFDEALKYYFIVLDGYLNNKNNKSKWIPSLYYDIAMIYLEKEEIEKALSHIREGLQYLDQTFTFEANDFYKNPAIEEVQNHRTFLKLLRKKSLLLQIRYSKTKKLQDLKAALKTSELAIELMQKMRRNHLSVSDKISLSARRGSVYRQGVEQAFELYQQTNSQQYLRQAFNISEKSKAGALLESINDQQALENENISVEDQVKITTITRKITNLKEMLFLEKDPALISKIKNELFDLNVDYEAFISSLEKNNNDYYQLKYAPLDISSDEIPQYLPNKNTALIQYFYSKKKVFIFVFIGEELFGFQQAIDADFEQKIHSLRNNQLLNASYNKDDLKNYIQTLNFFHELLIQPVLSNIKTCKNLIIIPHGILQYLSFEALCPSSATADFRTLDYLIKDHHIQYAWSVSLWAKQVKKQHTSTAYEFIGFAPGFKSTKALASITKDLFLTRGPQEILTHSIPEVEGANTYFPGETFTGAAATESQFLQKAPNSKIIHLATHAIADQQNPLQSGFLFSVDTDSTKDGFLSGLEIYNLKLSADLAVMSACNTGYGQLAKGEGIMSLSRAFMQAGCKSIIASLWLANDESTSSIIQGFYKHAADGLNKHEALQKAKLDYLQQADPLTAHPYFWANLVTVGDMSPLQDKSKNYLWWGILGLGLLVFLFFLSKKT